MIPQYEPLFTNERANIGDYLLTNSWLTEHIKTKEFEQGISNFLGVKHTIIVNNGTISLCLALLANGVKPGDRVLVPSLTMIATANAVRFIGAIPIFVDVEPETLCMDITQIPDYIKLWSPKAIIYVTFNGRQGNNKCIVSLNVLCSAKGIAVIEDNAQSFGSKNELGQTIGNSINLSSFSFSVPKIITTGQGGCLTTNNDELAQQIRYLKDFGRSGGGNDVHEHFGINCKFTDLQAVIGLTQMETINERINAKKNLALTYYNELKDIKQIKFIKTNLEYTVPWFVEIFVEDRDKLVEYLLTKDIQTRKMYSPIYTQKCYQPNVERHPVAEEYSRKGLWLPSSMILQKQEIIYICEMIRNYYEN